jgi:hypothetical protein
MAFKTLSPLMRVICAASVAPCDAASTDVIRIATASSGASQPHAGASARPKAPASWFRAQRRLQPFDAQAGKGQHFSSCQSHHGVFPFDIAQRRHRALLARW